MLRQVDWLGLFFLAAFVYAGLGLEATWRLIFNMCRTCGLVLYYFGCFRGMSPGVKLGGQRICCTLLLLLACHQHFSSWDIHGSGHAAGRSTRTMDSGHCSSIWLVFSFNRFTFFVKQSLSYSQCNLLANPFDLVPFLLIFCDVRPMQSASQAGLAGSHVGI